jgi:hypothetical protein
MSERKTSKENEMEELGNEKVRLIIQFREKKSKN